MRGSVFERQQMLADFRHALRSLTRRPLSTGAVIATLTVGLAAVTTVFSLLHAVLLAPLPYPEPQRLVRLYVTLEDLRASPNPRLAAMWDRLPASYQDTVDLRLRSRSLAGVGLFDGAAMVLEGAGEPEEVSAARVEPELLRLLGVEPTLGRWFAAGEAAGRRRVALLGDELWRSAFGTSEGVLGRAVRLDGEPHAIVGVMPRGFSLPGRDDRLWVPLAPAPDDLAHRDELRYTAVARLGDEATLQAARCEVSGIAAALAEEHPASNESTGMRLEPLLDTVVEESRQLLALLAAGAVAVLLIASVNVTHLLLARGEDVRRQTSLRLALGASRRRLLRGLLAEMLLLALAGAAGALLLTFASHRVLPALLVGEVARVDEVAVGGPVLLFALAAALLSGLTAGLLPAFRLTDPSLGEVTQERLARRSPSARGALVVTELAIALALVAAAAQLATAWLRLATADPGFATAGILVQEVRLPAWSYPDEGGRREFADRLLTALAALPGARGAALTSRLPGPAPAEIWGFRIAGRDPPSDDWTQGRSASMQFVTGDYLRLLEIPLLAGDGFDGTARAAGAERVVLVDQALAARHWPGGSPVGARVLMRGDTPHRVVGVTADVRLRPSRHEREELMMQPWGQGSPAAFAALVAVDGPPAALAEPVRRAVHRLDPSLPLPPAATLDEVVSESLAESRSQALLVGLAAGSALLLALVGTYAVAAQAAVRRRREIAIRMALGADRRAIRRLLLRPALAWALAGVALGAIGALAAGRLLATAFPDLEAPGGAAIAVAALLLVGACLAATHGPARRAARLHPAAILREE